MKHLSVWLTLAVVCVTNVLVPTLLIADIGERPVHAPGEFITWLAVIAGLHVVAGGWFVGLASFQRSNLAWVWAMAGGLTLTMGLLIPLYVYVYRYGANMSGIVFFWGPLAQIVAGMVVASLAAAVQSLWQRRSAPKGVAGTAAQVMD